MTSTIDYKVVPNSLEDITASWCQKVLHEGSAIDKETTVTQVEIKSITDEKTGLKDGGGFSGSNIVKLIPTYGGNVSGNEPSTIVCKISGNEQRPISFVWRLMIFAMYGPWEDMLNRHETSFYKKVAPYLTDTSFRFPKIYFAGLEDNGNNGFFNYVIMNKPSKVRSILLMEDLSNWKTTPIGTVLNNDELVMCLKNIAIMHARFWGKKKEEISDFLESPAAQSFDKEYRKSHYDPGKQGKLLASPNSIKKEINKLYASEWKENHCMKIPKTSKLPNWFTLPPSEDGSYSALDDPLVKEMYDVFAERLPKYHQECLKEFNEREPETLIHGDYHCGNHTFGVGQNEGQVIAFDFQATGKSLVTLEIVNLLPFSKEITDFQEIEDIIKEYHNALVEHGVNDYDWAKFSKDFEKALVTRNLMTLGICNMMKPASFKKLFAGISGEEKANLLIETLEKVGAFNKTILLLTSLYAKDKDNFLIPKE